MTRNEKRLERKLKYLRAIIIVAIVVLMVAGRVLVGGYREDAQAVEWLAAGNTAEAIAAYDRSIHWYLPGSPTVARAEKGLMRIAQETEAAGDTETALRAWRVLRSGLYASKWLVTPHPDVIERCDREIARLVSLKAPENERTAAREKELSILKRPVGPSVRWSLAAVFAFAAWTLGIVLFIFRAFGPKDEFYRMPAALIGLFILFSYALWMIALSKA